MRTETEGIVLRQFKTVNGRRMVLLFSKKYGKISAGTSIGERGKNRTTLALSPFTHGRYELYRGRETHHINGAEVVKAYYKIGEDVEKYMNASCALEFADKLLPEELPAPEIFALLLEFFEIMETREKKQTTPAIAFQWKAMQAAGSAPELNACVRCRSKEALTAFSVNDGGMVCVACQNNVMPGSDDALICVSGFDIIDVLKYFFENPLRSVRSIALNEAVERECQVILKAYRARHFNIGALKSESFLKEV